MIKWLLAGLVALTLVWSAAVMIALWPDEDGSDDVAAVSPAIGKADGRRGARSDRYPVRVSFRHPPAAGLLFDLRTGEVLWALHPGRRLPIASLTKMMTALLIVERHADRERVSISRKAARVDGSRIGLLRPGTRVSLRALLHGLILVSGNDAAVALAQHDAGSVPRFVDRMNAQARALGLTCSRFNTPHGLRDRGNHSCAYDLATLTRAALAIPRLRRIARLRHTVDRFPTRGGRLSLTSNNPFIQRRYPGITGLKTGYTDAAGRCYVITARRPGRELGVVLLDTPDPDRQIPRLLEAGFRNARKRHPARSGR